MSLGRMNRSLLLAVVLLVTGAFVLTGCGQGQQDQQQGEQQVEQQDQETITLTYAFFAPKWTFPGKQMQEWVREIEKRTDGRVEVETHYGGSLLGAKEMYSGVRDGVADIGLGFPGYDPSQFPVLSVFSLPLKIPNAMVGTLTYWDIIREYEPRALEDFKVIAAFTTEPAYIQSQEPIRSLSDLKGKKLRTRGAAIPTAEALGISPVGMPMPQVPGSLKKGVISGLVTSREVIQDFKLAPSIQYVTDYSMDVGYFAAVMNKQKWNSLPPDIQQEINGLRREMAVWTAAYHQWVNVRDALAWARQEHGLEIVDLEEGQREKWDRRIQNQVIDDWVEQAEGAGAPAQEILDRVKELRDHYNETWEREFASMEE